MTDRYTPLAGFGQNSLQFGMPTLDNLSLGSGLDTGGVASAAGNGTGGFQLGLNAPTLQMGLSGLNSLGNIWGAWQANKLARDQLDFTKSITNTNLNNSIQSYNTALSDRARARGFTEGKTDSEVQDYVSANKLSR